MLESPQGEHNGDKKTSASNYTLGGWLLFGGDILPITIVVGKRRPHRTSNTRCNSLYV